MKKSLLLFIIFLFPIICFSQSSKQQADVYFQKAIHLVNSESFDSILHYVKKADELLTQEEDWESLGDGINEVGKCLKRIDSLSQAIQLFQRYLPIIEEKLSSENEIMAKMYAYLGDTYRKQGRYHIAAKWFDKALQGFEDLDIENIFVAHIFRYRADIYSRYGHSYKALDLLQKSKSIYEKTQKSKFVVKTLMDIGIAHNNISEIMGDTSSREKALATYELAKEIYQEKLAVLENSPDPKKRIETLSAKAKLIINEADAKSDDLSPRELIETFKKALLIFESIGQKEFASVVNWSIGRLEKSISLRTNPV